MNNDIEIDFRLQLADVVKEAQLHYPMANNVSDACYLYWDLLSCRLRKQSNPVLYTSHLKFKLLSLLVFIPEQCN